MKYFIGHISALEFWRTYSFDRSRVSKASIHASSNRGSGTTLQHFLNKCDEIGLKRPIDVLVPSLESRRPSGNLRPHVWAHLPNSSFVKIDEGIYVSTPESCFVQLARDLSLPKLIAVGFELSGTYAVGTQFEGHLKTDMQPRTTPPRLRQYAARCSKGRGIARARKAAKYVIGESASPMETNLVMMLCLPSAQGGFSLPAPKLNWEITADEINPIKSSTIFMNKNTPPSQAADFKQFPPPHYPARKFRLDLYWPEYRFALEYDSDTFHASTSKLHADSERRTALEALGIRAISVTSRQVYDEKLFASLACTTARHLEKRIRIERSDFEERHRRLKKEILGRDVE